MRTNYTRRPIEERFWPKVNKSGPVVTAELGPCWDWSGMVLSAAKPYGLLGRVPASSRGPKIEQQYAHVVSWRIHNGPIPDPRLCVCHRCDRPRCVNPSHLFLGTRGDNNRDRNLKGRDGDHRGERNPNVKLTAAQVAEIRARYEAGGETQIALASEYGIAQPHVSRLVRGTSYTGQRQSRKEQDLLG